jgi:hypothetical protein
MLIPIDPRPVVRDVVHKHPVHLVLVLQQEQQVEAGAHMVYRI